MEAAAERPSHPPPHPYTADRVQVSNGWKRGRGCSAKYDKRGVGEKRPEPDTP